MGGVVKEWDTEMLQLFSERTPARPVQMFTSVFCPQGVVTD